MVDPQDLEPPPGGARTRRAGSGSSACGPSPGHPRAIARIVIRQSPLIPEVVLAGPRRGHSRKEGKFAICVFENYFNVLL